MLEFIKGKIVSVTPTEVILETPGGLGLKVLITLYTYEKIHQLPSCHLFTYLYIRKDGQLFSGYDIYGFSEIQDRTLFEMIITVSGIGANTARIILNSMTYEELQRAIANDDEFTISKVKGIGPKTAKRLILELRDKIVKLELSENSTRIAQNNSQNEALLALISLGFQKNKVVSVLQNIEKSNGQLTVEEYIKSALKAL